MFPRIEPIRNELGAKLKVDFLLVPQLSTKKGKELIAILNDIRSI